MRSLSLGLGGNAPFIVFDDADIEMAVRGHRLEIPQCRPDLRLRQPHPGAGRAFVVVPIVCAFFIDLMNLAVLTFFLLPGLVVSGK